MANRRRRLSPEAWLAEQEAEWNREIAAKMAEGLSFDEAWLAAGGEIIPTTDASPEAIAEITQAYAKVRPNG